MHSEVDVQDLGQTKICALCKGLPAVLLEFIDADENAAFAKHLCDRHLPLHCKKCSKVCMTGVLHCIKTVYSSTNSNLMQHSFN